MKDMLAIRIVVKKNQANQANGAYGIRIVEGFGRLRKKIGLGLIVMPASSHKFSEGVSLAEPKWLGWPKKI